MSEHASYPARLSIDYPERLDRLSTALRLFYILPIAIVLSLVTDGCGPVESPSVSEGDAIVRDLRELGVDVPAGVEIEVRTRSENPRGDGGGNVTGGLFAATMLMLVFRRRYPKWWFDFQRELVRFSARVGAYAALLTDRYPSTEDEQSVHLDIDAPDPSRLNQWLPLVKWFLAIPHYIALALLSIAACGAVVIAWVAVLFTGSYPRVLFDFVVGVLRWTLRVQAYAFLLVTDEYPPFSLS
jgi:hypothetical protein